MPHFLLEVPSLAVDLLESAHLLDHHQQDPQEAPLDLQAQAHLVDNLVGLLVLLALLDLQALAHLVDHLVDLPALLELLNLLVLLVWATAVFMFKKNLIVGKILPYIITFLSIIDLINNVMYFCVCRRTSLSSNLWSISSLW